MERFRFTMKSQGKSDEPASAGTVSKPFLLLFNSAACSVNKCTNERGFRCLLPCHAEHLIAVSSPPRLLCRPIRCSLMPTLCFRCRVAIIWSGMMISRMTAALTPAIGTMSMALSATANCSGINRKMHSAAMAV